MWRQRNESDTFRAYPYLSRPPAESSDTASKTAPLRRALLANPPRGCIRVIRSETTQGRGERPGQPGPATARQASHRPPWLRPGGPSRAHNHRSLALLIYTPHFKGRQVGLRCTVWDDSTNDLKRIDPAPYSPLVRLSVPNILRILQHGGSPGFQSSVLDISFHGSLPSLAAHPRKRPLGP